MTISQLQQILANALKAHGDVEVMADTRTFPEDENGSVFSIEAAEIQDVQGVDDSGPVGGTEPMLVIRGIIEWHEHGK